MYKVLVDSNIFVDFMFRRQPFYSNSEKVISLCEKNIIKGYVTTSILMDLRYIFYRMSHSNADADNAVKEILKVFKVISVEEKDIVNSVEKHQKDFEDSVVEECSSRNKLNCIVTRNVKDFKNEKIKVITPEELLSMY